MSVYNIITTINVCFIDSFFAISTLYICYVIFYCVCKAGRSKSIENYETAIASMLKNNLFTEIGVIQVVVQFYANSRYIHVTIFHESLTWRAKRWKVELLLIELNNI